MKRQVSEMKRQAPAPQPRAIPRAIPRALLRALSRALLCALICALLCVLPTGCAKSGGSAKDGNAAESGGSAKDGNAAESGGSADLWGSAAYTEDAVLGSGKTTVAVEVKAGDKAVTLTLKTDGETLGDALLENRLVEGEEGEFGLYVRKVIGIEADYDTDRSYWAFYRGGEMLPTGIDGEKLKDGAHYEIVRTK